MERTKDRNRPRDKKRDRSLAGPNDAKRHKYDARNPIGYKKLQNVLKIDCDAELILKLSSEMNGFLLLLDQTNIRCDLMCLILAAFGRVSECSTDIDADQLLIHFYMKIIPKLQRNANFQRELIMYSVNLRNYLDEEQSHKRQMHIDAVQNLLTFLRRLQLILYQKSFDIVQDIVQQFELQIEFINRKGNQLNDRIIQLLTELNDSLQHFNQLNAESKKREVLLEPPNNFRDIPIYPTTEDILFNHEPFIRKNVIEGKYVGGVDHYLDTQFRLLREDFVRPLRNGISEYVQLSDKAEAMKAANYRIKDLNVYRNVNILSSQMNHNEQIHLCKFDRTPFQNLRWQNSKRMMNGSLMCLSPDDFKTFFFATVTGLRNAEELNKGSFQIKLEIEDASMPEITPLITYVMVESQVYFEAYRHNLKVLQELNKDNFPLERYIVDVNKYILPPTYLTENTVYNIPNGLHGNDANYLTVDILNRENWPSQAELNLDESQYDAFRAALTKQIAVIQGPPGTGKTYIGLRIVQTLLANAPNFPILVICYTNHALDQFLEGILQFCDKDKLIRIGGKSQSERLENLNLRNIKKQMKTNRQVTEYIHNARYESTSLMKRYQMKITQCEKQIEEMNVHFIGCELQDVIKNINEVHWRQLERLERHERQQRRRRRRFSTEKRSMNIGILHWLGYEVLQVKNRSDENKNHNAERFFSQNMFLNEGIKQELFDEEEINEIERKRYINYYSDDEDDHHQKHHSDQNQDNNWWINLNDIVQINHRGNKKCFKTTRFYNEIQRSQSMTIEEAAAVSNIDSLPNSQRWNLYRLWLKLYVEEICRKINDNRDLYRNECLRFNGIRNQEDIEVVKKAKVIGMTTTGAAKFNHIITGIKPRITIVEEAAEVLEAHIVTALSGKTDHLILIGDHMQLRPNPAVYELSKKFNLEISLFERLINNQMEFYQLKQQHRMRSCISSLLVPHIYKQLLDHPSVEQYEDILGIAKNMFFINHQQNEISQQETRSHMNLHEAKFIVELCRYIILQGYSESQVTILTTYSGQLHQIRQLMHQYQQLNNVRATVVDNYQGEENDIILLSFVRSNDEANIGFLKTSNRINVALSRARKGLYCIGNFNCLAEKSQLWKDLIQSLTNQNAIGDSLEIFCQNHIDYRIFAKTDTDFSQTPDGGCMRPCESRLLCGHSCTSICHVIDKEHEGIYKRCPKKCDKIMCDNEHRCQKQCHFDAECGQCMILVEKVHPNCGHTFKAKCFSDVSKTNCTHPCERDRSCSHKCQGLCGEDCNATICNVQIEEKSPCGHTVKIECSNANNSLKLLNACSKPCNIELKCGHLCKGTCGRCKYGRLHISCKEKCTRILICGHPCNDSCSIDCSPCKKVCNNRCVHTECNRRCGEPCPPCMEKCQWKCKHLKCTKLCSEPCDRELCMHADKRFIRKCRHRSIGVCGEKIPHLCRVCNKDQVEEIFFGNEDEKNARFIELVDCKHIIEVDGLMQWMRSEPGSTESNATDSNQINIQLKKCPKCKTEIRNTNALNTFIQASLKDVQQVKLQTYGNRKDNLDMQNDLNERTKLAQKGQLFHGLRPIFQQIERETELKPNSTSKPKPKHVLIENYNKFRLANRLLKIFKCFDERNPTAKTICDKMITLFTDRMKFATDFIKSYRNCDQKRQDIETEIEFLYVMAQVIAKSSHATINETGTNLLNDAFKLAHQYGNATETIQSEFKKMVDDAFKQSTGLGISINEQKMILKAMGFQKGHWYKCPNGHYYCIGECGGAMQKSVCPDCKAEIGGGNHSLVAGNTLATEMDGALTPAWPTNLLQQ